MTNMIDVNSLWNCETCFHHKNGKCDTWCESGESYRPAYSKLKVVEAVEVVHGEWSHLGGDEWCCTNCGEVIHTEGSWEKPEKKFCHECGAKMDGKKV